MGLITKQHTFTDDDPIVYTDLNANWDALYNLVNGNLDNSNIASGAAIDPLKISGGAVTLTTAQIIAGQKTIINPLLQAYNGWIISPDTYVYISGNSFSITNSNDLTPVYTKGTRIKFTNNSSTFYGVVQSSLFSGGVTTVTLIANTDYAINNSAITNPFYSYDASPQGYPTWFNTVVGAWVGFSANPVSLIRFAVIGNMITLLINTGIGTSNNTSFSITLPVIAITSDLHVLGTGFDNGGYVQGCSPGYLSGNLLTLYKITDQGTNAWTASGNKGWSGQFSYQF